jgi:Protein ChrB, N-terminal
MPGRLEWVLLAYRIPREPSTPRISVWRKLRRLGTAQLGDGLVALPKDARTKEQLEWIADEVLEAGGEANLWIARAGSIGQERSLASGMAAAVAEEYQAVIEAADAARSESGSAQRRSAARLRRELHRIGQRDHFPPAEREKAHRAVEGLVQSVEASR